MRPCALKRVCSGSENPIRLPSPKCALIELTRASLSLQSNRFVFMVTPGPLCNSTVRLGGKRHQLGRSCELAQVSKFPTAEHARGACEQLSRGSGVSLA
eukprot:CAMPEP_0182946248 /NCGR_PEP_ID=MMETSP0105_2-20130417/56764_1 /TAXON_ID=81532 ORGANISM="Acanthoeca-like sp., Strain 10tr" /NCGR_SAMPLE_ID=MMETSP0105_2 /ASSEMBLY_ACC=CAM_ASM_000205 /LENGTH=98 /DNA_ID=CAMNT_0025086355 /DNA_START=245 /DNA_END=538 /DNA_ORIENTATION=-